MTAGNDSKAMNSENGKPSEYVLSDEDLIAVARDLKADFNWARSHGYLKTLEKNAVVASSVQTLLAIEDEFRKRRKEQEKTDNRRPVRLVPRQPG